MKISFASRTGVSRMEGNGKVLISIRDPNKSKPVLAYKWDDILELNFDDLCPNELKVIGRSDLIQGSKFFSEEDAKSILEFVAKHGGEKEIVVHCEKGRSRSAAVAIFLADKFGEIGNEKEYVDKCNPNPHVASILQKVYQGSVEDESN